mmetsp:Transcript_12303/g.23349  ORF Transcript_12303/g.23349 Transcript_12303/m.23349 type:complete len:360 (+) Transcript_12303:5988-7067(+)
MERAPQNRSSRVNTVTSFPSASEWIFPSIKRGQTREKPSQRHMHDRSFPPWVDPSKLTTDEINWYKEADIWRRIAPPAKIAEQLRTGNVRFISGVRKQPMHKKPTTLTSLATPVHAKSHKTSPKSLKKSPKSRPKAADSVRDISKRDSTKAIEAKRKRKSKKKIPAIVHKIDHISDQLNGLQQKLQDFEGKYQQLKGITKTPDSVSDVSSAHGSRGSYAVVIHQRREATKKLELSLRLCVLFKYWSRLKNPRIKIKKHAEALRPLTQPPVTRKPFADRPLPVILESSEVAENRNEKAVVIQSGVRMFLARRRFLKKRNAAIVIQKNVRAYQTSRLYANIRSAIIFIQSSFRKYKSSKLV